MTLMAFLLGIATYELQPSSSNSLSLLYSSLEASVLAKNGGMECVSNNSPTSAQTVSWMKGILQRLVRAPVTLWEPAFLPVYHWPFHPLAGAMPHGSKVVHLHLSLFISLYSTFDNICKNYMEPSFRTLKLAANQEPMLWSSSTIRNGRWVAEVRGAELRRVFRWGTIWWESQTSL